MKSVTYKKYGSAEVLEISEVEIPAITDQIREALLLYRPTN